MPRSAIAAILLGASSFPSHASFGATEAFFQSKEDFKSYLIKILGVNRILDLFDSNMSESDILIEIAYFVENYARSKFDITEYKDLIFFYVGHGYPSQVDPSDYHLALASTREGYEEFTSLNFGKLAYVLRKHASTMRKFIILDCCYAGAALGRMAGEANQQDIVSVRTRAQFAEKKTANKLIPDKGAALYCAASKYKEAVAPLGQKHTMFSDALLYALTTGSSGYGRLLSLEEVSEITWDYLVSKHQRDAVRPEVHAPDQSGGNVAKAVFLFPNPQGSEDDESLKAWRQQNFVLKHHFDFLRTRSILLKRAFISAAIIPASSIFFRPSYEAFKYHAVRFFIFELMYLVVSIFVIACISSLYPARLLEWQKKRWRWSILCCYVTGFLAIVPHFDFNLFMKQYISDYLFYLTQLPAIFLPPIFAYCICRGLDRLR